MTEPGSAAGGAQRAGRPWTQVGEPRTRTALAVWAVGLSVYLLAVFHRSSLAVAGLAAAERFDISASQLATFTTLQLLVYAGMQIPVGLLVDRFGSRRVLLTGLVILTLAQTVFALAESYPVALLARFFVGMGDAMTFICVLRLAARWFPVRRIPLVTQLTGTVGQSGAILAAAPMTWALGSFGWTRSYLGAASVGLLLGVLVLLFLWDAPGRRSVRGATLSLGAMRTSLGLTWAQPGSRLGFWMHFSTPFSANALGMLWGYPFLVRGEGRSPGEAAALLSLMVLATMVAGPTMGWLVGRHPWHRSTLVMSIIAVVIVMWTLVLSWPGDTPLGLLVLLIVTVGIAGPASLIGLDVARTSNPPERMASASGIINVGGFASSLLVVIGVGLVLDWRTPGGGSVYPAEAFRWAMSVQFLVWGLGLTQIWRYRRRTRAVLRAQGADVSDLR